MSPSSQSARSEASTAEPELAPLADVPADWHGLWEQILAARSGAAVRASRGALVSLRADSGWCIKGPCSARSAALFDLYKPLLDARSASGETGQGPWVVAQMGQSLDGFVATATGDSYYVNGAHSLLHLHRLRALCDAVIVGAGTVAIDNPQLTTRRVPGPNPVRVLLDPMARLEPRAKALTDAQAPTLWVCDAAHAERARERLVDSGAGDSAEVVAVAGLLLKGAACSECDTHKVLQALAHRGLRVVFVEGGGVTVSRFFAARAIQRLHLSVAPVLIGNGRRGLQVPAHDTMAECPRPPARMVVLGDDMLWDLDLSASHPAP